jgi:hypothetical protein
METPRPTTHSSPHPVTHHLLPLGFSSQEKTQHHYDDACALGGRLGHGGSLGASEAWGGSLDIYTSNVIVDIRRLLGFLGLGSFMLPLK